MSKDMRELLSCLVPLALLALVTWCELSTSGVTTSLDGWTGYAEALFPKCWGSLILCFLGWSAFFGGGWVIIQVHSKIKFYFEMKEAERYYRENGSDYYRF